MRSDNKRPQEQLKPLSLPNILEEIECVNEYWRELMEGASSAVKAFSHDLGRPGLTRQYPDELLTPPAMRLRDEMRNLVGPAESFYERWHEVAERSSSVVEAFSRDFEQAQLAGKRLDELLNPPAMRSLRDVMSSLDHRIKSINNHMEVTPEGAISLGNDVLSIGEIEGAIEDFFSQIPEIDFSERFWECSWERLQPLNDIVKSIIIYIFNKIVLNFIISIITGAILLNYEDDIKSYFNKYIFRSERDVKQAIKKILMI